MLDYKVGMIELLERVQSRCLFMHLPCGLMLQAILLKMARS